MELTNNNNKHIITNKIGWIRQIFISYVTLLLSSEVSVAFDLSSSHVNINLLNRRFSNEQFLIWTPIF